MCMSPIQKYGASPANIQWSVVRGDSAVLQVQFLEADETTPMNTTGWTYQATAYDASGDVLDELLVNLDNGVMTITAPASLTLNWGKGYKSVVAELPFDLQINIPADGENTVWTPVIGTICVLGDVSPGGSL